MDEVLEKMTLAPESGAMLIAPMVLRARKLEKIFANLNAKYIVLRNAAFEQVQEAKRELGMDLEAN